MAVHFEPESWASSGLSKEYIPTPSWSSKSAATHHSSRGAPLVVMFMGYTPLFAAAMAIAATWSPPGSPGNPHGPKRILQASKKAQRAPWAWASRASSSASSSVPCPSPASVSPFGFQVLSTWEKGSSNLGGVFVMVMSTILEHGRARRCGLRHRCGRGRARAYRRRRAAHVRPHVLPLLRLPLQHHAAGGHVVLRGRRHRQLQRNQNLPHRRAAGTLRLHPCRSSSSTIRCCSTAPPIPDSPPCGPSSPQASASAPSPWASNAGSSAPVPCLQSLMFIAGPPVLTIDPASPPTPSASPSFLRPPPSTGVPRPAPRADAVPPAQADSEKHSSLLPRRKEDNFNRFRSDYVR